MLATAARRAAFEGTEAASAPARDRAQRGAASALGASRLERHAPSARGAGALQDGASVVLCPKGCGASNEHVPLGQGNYKRLVHALRRSRNDQRAPSAEHKMTDLRTIPDRAVT